MPTNRLSHFRICIACLCMLQLFSCIKVPKDFDPRGADNFYDGCRIKQTSTQSIYQTVPQVRKFNYNSHNDPISITGSTGGTGDPNPVFKYDNKHRLIEFAGNYLNGGYEFLHHYKYEKDRIVIDTQWIFGMYNAPPPIYVSYDYLRYDKFDRITQDSIVYFSGGHQVAQVTNYDYDANGNLIFYGYDENGNRINTHIPYDSKLSPRRLNKIWMFIDRNYSVNNPFTADSYNSSGLPLKFNLNSYFLRSYYSGPTEIKYDCK